MGTTSPVDETRRFTGPEKRGYSRIPASYPICVRFGSSSGKMIERYAQTHNVSVEGVLFSCMEELEVGTKVSVLMGIPSAYAASLPAAQLNGEAVVVRCESLNAVEDIRFGALVALRFLEKPAFTTQISMFD